MKVLAISLLLVSAVTAGSGPYLPSGWRPSGPAFLLPTEIKETSPQPLKDVPLQETSGSELFREYGPPEFHLEEVSQDLRVQDLPSESTGQPFLVLQARLTEEEMAAEEKLDAESNISSDESSTVSKTSNEVRAVAPEAQGRSLNINAEVEIETEVINETEKNGDIVEESEEVTTVKNVNELTKEVAQFEEIASVKEVSQVEEVTTVKNVNEVTKEVAQIEEIASVKEVSQVEEVTTVKNVNEVTKEVAQFEEIASVKEVSQVEEVTTVKNVNEVTKEVAQIEEIASVKEVSQVEEVKKESDIITEAIEENVNSTEETTESLTKIVESTEKLVKETEEKIEEDSKNAESNTVINIEENVQSEIMEEIKTIEKTLANLENLEKVQQAQDVVIEKKSTANAFETSVLEGFLEYGPPGFTEYGPPKESDLLRSPTSNEVRRRRFSPKLKVVQRRQH